MANYFDKNEERRQELRKYYQEKPNLRLKHWAFLSISIAILLMMTMIFAMEHIPVRLLLLMRGCVGLLALIFVILVGILTYRVNSSYYKNKH